MEASKKRRRQSGKGAADDEPPLDLLSLYQSDFGDRLFSFATGADLCTLDILSKQFKRLTANQWKVVTKDRFGMNNGKEGWRLGTSFLRPPVFIYLTDVDSNPKTGDSGYGFGCYPGNSRVATNESIIVAVSEDARIYCHPNNEMGMRDVSTLNYIRSVPSPIRNWRVSICGRVGTEVIVTSNYHEFCARRGNDIQRWSYDVQIGLGIPSIGCETHLIIPTNGRINIYEVNLQIEGRQEDNNTKLLLFRECIIAAGNVSRYDTQFIAWGPDKKHFIVSFNQVEVYKFDKETGNATLVESIDVVGDSDLAVANVALAEDYIVICSHDRKIHIWNRSTGEKMVYPGADQNGALCDYCPDSDDEDEDDVDEILEGTVHPLFFSCHGHILVSTSFCGCAICIWDMKTGELLKRYNNAEEERYTNLLPDGNDATDMTYLESLNAFLCMEWYMNIWSFPTNKRQYDMATSTRRREEIVRRALTQEDNRGG